MDPGWGPCAGLLLLLLVLVPGGDDEAALAASAMQSRGDAQHLVPEPPAKKPRTNTVSVPRAQAQSSRVHQDDVVDLRTTTVRWKGEYSCMHKVKTATHTQLSQHRSPPRIHDPPHRILLFSTSGPSPLSPSAMSLVVRVDHLGDVAEEPVAQSNVG